MEEKYAKLGLLYGYDVYLDMSSKQAHDNRKNEELTKAREFFEKSFKHHDFIEQLKEIFHN